VLSIHLDTALNLLWAAISVAALLWFGAAEWNRRGGLTRSGSSKRLFAVFLMAIAIFPSISDSDDLFHFSLLQIPTRQGGGFGSVPQEDGQEKDSLHLARLLQSLEHFQASGFFQFTFALYCVAISLSLCLTSFTRSTGCNAGRAPPLS
jgi:hypothetical protein